MRIIQKKNSFEPGIKNILLVIVSVMFQLKNLLYLASLILYLVSFNYFNGEKYTKEDLFSPDFDHYNLAIKKRDMFVYDCISFLFMIVYILKYYQLIDSIGDLIRTVKRAGFEYLVQIVIIIILFLGLSILTSFVYGSYMFEFRNFEQSILTNIKLFILVEDTNVILRFITDNRGFTIIVLIIFVMILKFVLLNMFFGIFIEYYRLTYERLDHCKYHYSEDGFSFTNWESNFLN